MSCIIIIQSSLNRRIGNFSGVCVILSLSIFNRFGNANIFQGTPKDFRRQLLARAFKRSFFRRTKSVLLQGE